MKNQTTKSEAGKLTVRVVGLEEKNLFGKKEKSRDVVVKDGEIQFFNVSLAAFYREMKKGLARKATVHV